MRSRQFSPLNFIMDFSTSFSIPSDPDLIPTIASYVGGLFENATSAELSRSVELVLDEALSNAIFHGNLEVPSMLKEGNFNDFYEVAKKRSVQAPFRLRRAYITLSFSGGRLEIRVRDEGRGFDWRKLAKLKEGDSGDPFGRGLKIIRAMTSKMEFNEAGNEIVLVFEGLALSSAGEPGKNKQG